MTEITVAETSSLLNTPGKELLLVDCREEDEFQICRIEGARLIPLSEIAHCLETKLADQEAEIVIYCHHGMRSAQAAQFLEQKGYANVRSMSGGIDLWSQEIDPEVPRY